MYRQYDLSMTAMKRKVFHNSMIICLWSVNDPALALLMILLCYVTKSLMLYWCFGNLFFTHCFIACLFACLIFLRASNRTVD